MFLVTQAIALKSQPLTRPCIVQFTECWKQVPSCLCSFSENRLCSEKTPTIESQSNITPLVSQYTPQHLDLLCLQAYWPNVLHGLKFGLNIAKPSPLLINKVNSMEHGWP
ncbi:hypothetical protein PoB_005653300 [Plakobranchus ocellatus]|uniref:Uncharacterized protein n=1 Tax=Plakobranchus ocellatus TaxID=259542 RepID=A0AAV4CGA3_9GAST|nr:hypothetical protein PoB_005653300 [Plakobranchus ocellatus]